MLRFDVVAELVVDAASLGDQPPLPRMVQRPDPRLARYLARNSRFHAARRLAGFEGYSIRPGCAVVIHGEHLPLDPFRPGLFKEQ